VHLRLATGDGKSGSGSVFIYWASGCRGVKEVGFQLTSEFKPIKTNTPNS
jgi:hypothetical protein